MMHSMSTGPKIWKGNGSHEVGRHEIRCVLESRHSLSALLPRACPLDDREEGHLQLLSSMAGLQCSVIDTFPLKRPKLFSGSPDGAAGLPSSACLPTFLRWRHSCSSVAAGRGIRSWGNRKSNLDFHIPNLHFPIPTCHFSLSTRPSCRPRPCPWPSSPRSGSRRPPSPSCAAGPFACSFPRRAPP